MLICSWLTFHLSEKIPPRHCRQVRMKVDRWETTSHTARKQAVMRLKWIKQLHQQHLLFSSFDSLDWTWTGSAAPPSELKKLRCSHEQCLHDEMTLVGYKTITNCRKAGSQSQLGLLRGQSTWWREWKWREMFMFFASTWNDGNTKQEHQQGDAEGEKFPRILKRLLHFSSCWVKRNFLKISLTNPQSFRPSCEFSMLYIKFFSSLCKPIVSVWEVHIRRTIQSHFSSPLMVFMRPRFRRCCSSLSTPESNICGWCNTLDQPDSHACVISISKIVSIAYKNVFLLK